MLLQKLSTGSGGYFDTINGYAKNRAPDSNAREMVVVAADSVLNNTSTDFLAHELQHLISFYQKELLLNVSEDTWLNEARSEYSITLAGYDVPFAGSTLQRRIQTFLRTPNDSLTEWPNTSTDYGVASVFIHYLADRFGPGILQYTLHSRSSGAAAIQDWLSPDAAVYHAVMVADGHRMAAGVVQFPAFHRYADRDISDDEHERSGSMVCRYRGRLRHVEAYDIVEFF